MPIELGFRAWVRGCGYNHLESDSNITCDDVSKYPKNIQQAIGSLLMMGSDPKSSVQGNMCFCKQDNCNNKLPEAKQATLPNSTSTSIQTKKPEPTLKTTKEPKLDTKKKPEQRLKTTTETDINGYKVEPSQVENKAGTMSFCLFTVLTTLSLMFL